MFWPFYPAAQYLLVDAKGIVIKKWRKTGQHFVDQNTERPPVNCLIVSFALNYFWRQIFWCAAQSPRSAIVISDNNYSLVYIYIYTLRLLRLIIDEIFHVIEQSRC